MGRDFTPKELLASESVLGDLFQVQRNMNIFISVESLHYYSEEELAYREQLPILGKLLNIQSFYSLYASASAVAGGLDFLATIDKDLQEYIATGKGDRDSATIRWFEGTLDENFYYCERNEDLFVEKLQEDLSHLKPTLDDKIRSVEARSSPNGNTKGVEPER